MEKIDLSEVGFELENAEKFLICFSEFCDREGYSIKGVDESAVGICFITRLPQFAPLLNHAIDIIHEQRKVIERTYTTGEEVVA